MSTEIPFTAVSFFSLLGVFAASVAGYFGATVVLSKNSTFWERFAFIWLASQAICEIDSLLTVDAQAFDGLIHFCVEGERYSSLQAHINSCKGPFLYLSTFGRTVNTSTGPLADMCEYKYTLSCVIDLIRARVRSR